MTAKMSVETTESIRILKINNPEKRNAFDQAMAFELRDQLLRADADPQVRCIIVTGSEETFSSGHDLQEVLANPETASDPRANEGFTAPANINTPVIGAINGAAYAAGFILAINCDIRIAGENARFCAVGARIGLVPVGGQLSRILELVSYQTAIKMLTTATPVSAEEAFRVGLVSDICSPSQTLDSAISLAHKISQVSPSVVKAIKTGLRFTMRNGLDAGMKAESDLAAIVRGGADGDEGIRSFLEKRPPSYPPVPRGLQEELDKVGGNK